MFIVSPRLGLCNQLQALIKGLLLGKKYNKTVYINKFQINLEDNSLCDINEVLDIDSMNNFYEIHNLNIKIHKHIDQSIIENIEEYKLKELDYNSLPNMSCINNFIENNIDKQIMYLGNPVMLNITDTFDLNYNLYNFLMNNIFFNKKFYDIKDDIKKQLNLTDYTCMHLRIEDDALHHFSHCYNLTLGEYNKKLLDFYLDKINKEERKIYVCSGILKFSNKINYDFYTNLSNNNDLICDKKNIIIDDYIQNNRELIAIVDLLIAFDSDYFVGCWISSFSQLINSYFSDKGKRKDLFCL
jgi:hypothetical protein